MDKNEIVELNLKLTKENAYKLQKLLDVIEIDDLNDECVAIVFKKETFITSEKNVFITSLDNVVLKSKNKIHLNPKLSVAELLYKVKNKISGFLK